MKKKILIVEDNKDSSEILGLFITKIGHHPIKAKNSKEAITITEAEQPDLIFMDLDLPDVDGVKTTAMLRRNPKTSHIPVNLLNKTDLTSGVKGNHRGMHERISHPKSFTSPRIHTADQA